MDSGSSGNEFSFVSIIVIVHYDDNHHQVSGWTLNVEFDSPLDDLQCFEGDVSPKSDGVST